MSLDWVYYITCGFGFLFIVGSAALGHLGDETADHGGGHDAGHDAGHGGHGHHDGHGHHGHDDDGHHHDHDHDTQKLSSTTKAGLPGQTTGLYLTAMRVISPVRIALFAFFFGAFGIACLRVLPIMGYVSLPIALLAGWACAEGTFRVLGMFLSKLGTRTDTFREESVLGAIGELSTPIAPGKTGEITFVTRGGRNSGPARSKDPAKEIKKLSQVIVVDVQDGIYYVEPAEDNGLSMPLSRPQLIEEKRED